MYNYHMYCHLQGNIYEHVLTKSDFKFSQYFILKRNTYFFYLLLNGTAVFLTQFYKCHVSFAEEILTEIYKNSPDTSKVKNEHRNIQWLTRN